MPKANPHSEVRERIARNLKRQLAKNKMTTHALAEKAGVDRSNLYKVQKKAQTISADILAHVADALGCDITDFFTK